MSSIAPEAERVSPRSAGFFKDLRSVSLRAIRLTWRDPEAFLPALGIPVFFFVVNVGALQKFVEGSFPAGFDYKAFQLPVAVVFAVTGVSRANSLVLDIQNGYFDRLLLTPVSRGTLLLGEARHFREERLVRLFEQPREVLVFRHLEVDVAAALVRQHPKGVPRVLIRSVSHIT